MRRTHFFRLPKLRTRYLIEHLTHAKTGRCAFTLVDVLVAIASIGIMFALTTPTVRKISAQKTDEGRPAIVVSNGWKTNTPETPF